MDEAQCHAIAIRRYLLYAALCVVASIGILIWKVVNIERVSVAVPAIERQTAEIKAEVSKDKETYLQQHDITHKQVQRVLDTQHHIMAQQDANIKEIRQIKSKLK